VSYAASRDQVVNLRRSHVPPRPPGTASVIRRLPVYQPDESSSPARHAYNSTVAADRPIDWSHCDDLRAGSIILAAAAAAADEFHRRTAAALDVNSVSNFYIGP